MKKQTILFSLLMVGALALQSKRSQAQETQPFIIRATTEMVRPDNGSDDPNPPIETNTMIYVKGSHIKTESKSDFSHNITIIDKDAKRTTNLSEANGRRSGYYSIDTPKTAPAVTDSNAQRRPTSNIEYVDSTKTIAGYTCKKAVVSTSFGDRRIVTNIWYTTDLPLKEPLPQGGGRGGFGGGGMTQLKGFPMAYDITMSNGFSMEYKVTKVEMNAKISDNEFDVPKGYDVKPESERPRGGGFGGGGGGFRGGPGGGGPGGPGGGPGQ